VTELAITQATHAPEPSHEPLLVPVLTGHRRAEYLFSAAVWACAFVYFWIWWMEPRHVQLREPWHRRPPNTLDTDNRYHTSVFQ
jgi:hypothetical protein